MKWKSFSAVVGAKGQACKTQSVECQGFNKQNDLYQTW